MSYMVLYITITLNKNYSAQIIHGYAPTGSSEDEEGETFYEGLGQARRPEESQFVIVTGDFNLKIRTIEQGDTRYVGSFGLGNRNEKEKMLFNYNHFNPNNANGPGPDKTNRLYRLH